MHAENTRGRIALVLLHGIGEQRPMATLRGFVKGVFGEHGRSKPDRLSELFEVRRLDVRSASFTVDCYELYWAHHMQSSALAHIAKWLLRLLRTPADQLRRMAGHLGTNLYIRIRAGAAGLMCALAAVLLMATYVLSTLEWFDVGAGAFVASVTIAVLGVAWRVMNHQLVEVVGDAARYLDSAPANVGVRQEIRTDCVRLLSRLNGSADPDYTRIVVIGHSLGSVIAYDALRLMWANLDTHATLSASVAEPKGSLDWLHGGVKPDGELAYSPQRALFKHVVAGGGPRWRISDLVTVGSPLTHAPLLFAESYREFEHLKAQRELPTCPPQMDTTTDYCGWVEGSDFKLHHAAAFAVVHWTNIFFPNDPIGGPLRPIFGSGVEDVELDDAPDRTWAAHVRYWSVGDRRGSSKFSDRIVSLLLENRQPT